MKKNVEKRACERWNHNALIAVSYINQEPFFDIQTLNHSLDGMCFKSSFFLQPGAFLFIRAIKFNPNGSCKYSSEGLRSVTLAEVKWCSEVPGDQASQYVVGVKYFAPAYWLAKILINVLPLPWTLTLLHLGPGIQYHGHWGGVFHGNEVDLLIHGNNRNSFLML